MRSELIFLARDQAELFLPSLIPTVLKNEVSCTICNDTSINGQQQIRERLTDLRVTSRLLTAQWRHSLVLMPSSLLSPPQLKLLVLLTLVARQGTSSAMRAMT